MEASVANVFVLDRYYRRRLDKGRLGSEMILVGYNFCFCGMFCLFL